MILNAATLFWQMRFLRAIPVEAKLLTWECMTTFDEIPEQVELERMFEMEFPRTSRRLQECGGFYRIWHLVSFNSSEGRRSRFLVALVEKRLEKGTFEKISRRVLPEQIWLSAAADQAICMLPESDNAGNYLCYAHAEGRLLVLVFFEGRLCHWSEDFVGRHAKLDLALSRFRRFLESDALFSRAKHFEEISLQGFISQEIFSQALFKRASRDSVWRWRDLRKPEVTATKGFAEFVGAILGRKTCWLAILALALLLGKFGELGAKLKSDLLPNVADVVPPELSMPEISSLEESLQEISPDWNAVVEPPESSAPRVRKSICLLPEVFLKGVVGEEIAVVAVAGEPKEISAGDSLGSFEVWAVGRDQITLACGDSTVVKKVGVHEL